MNWQHIGLSALCLVLCTALDAKRKSVSPHSDLVTCDSLPDGPATIFIHGTVLPVVSFLVHQGNFAPGLYKAQDCHVPGLKKIANILNEASSEQFSFNTFYFYNWTGELSFLERKNAATLLFDKIKSHKGPLTLIAHSHGCNVALYLAELVQNNSFSIDHLILLAAPVQIATENLVNSSIFKKIYSFYSSADIVQVGDPQGIYKESKRISTDKRPPLFSKRVFPDAPHLIQARVLLDRQSPSHRSFIAPRFLKKLPHLIELLEEASHLNQNSIIVNIPPTQPPHIMQQFEVAHAYVPRTRRGRHSFPPVLRYSA